MAEENNVAFVPMEYTVGGEARIAEGIEDDSVMRDFYAAQRKGIETTTSQISPFKYEETFRKYLEKGQSVLYFCLSSGLSDTYQASLIAVSELKDEFPDLSVISIDTLSATGGIGYLVERAIENRKKGMGIQENYESVLEVSSKLHQYFLVQDLMYLLRGGRVSAASAYVGTALNIRPILKIDTEGKLQTIAKKRGNKAAVKCLLDYFEELYDPAEGNLVYMCDGDEPELSSQLKESLLEKHPDLVIRQTMLCPVIGAHTGPGMASVIFAGKERI